ncbi:unnamed protein product [Brachionus calyciflorus]|uniref:Uncharacterized protein n=1 Tax=Brachionus calyciflorus TaxID=104777 RepID=A0A813SWJ9_9BILA|nr:unnamed protein product [Brachionus calyciflorus]
MKSFGIWLLFCSIQLYIISVSCFDQSDKSLESFSGIFDVIKDIYLIILYLISSIFTFPHYWIKIILEFLVFSATSLFGIEVVLLLRKLACEIFEFNFCL